MPGSIAFLVVIILSAALFAVPERVKHHFTLGLLVAGIAITASWSVSVLASPEKVTEISLFTNATGLSMVLVIDAIAAFFILIINIAVLTGLLYARRYLSPYREKMNPLRFSIHYFSYLWLWISMVMVVMLRDGVSFLVAWEIMALSSFFLVIFEAEERNIMKTGISYLVQMHVGMFFIMVAFLILQKETGRMSFDALADYFAVKRNLPLFLLFFTGFAIKAGFIPFHTWLPDAHPAAPSHVSGVMSGVMIKMGIYGIIRVLISMQSDLLAAGLIILLISLFSGVMGVMMAIVQKDLKRLLAYSSIENIGIIGIGLGMGVIGIAAGNNTLSLLGLSGSLLHIVNHSLFKSMLFFNAGSVYHATHTRNMELTGGLMKRMPWTALFFLTAALSISGLPPFNGFVSEYIIYMGMFNSLSEASLFQSIVIIGSVAALALTGGLAIFCFTRAFGIVFQGEPRSEAAGNAREVHRGMIIPQFIPMSLIMLIGLGSPLFVRPLFDIVAETFNLGSHAMIRGAFTSNLAQISLAGGVMVTALAALLLYRRYHLGRRIVESGPTWGCGYTAVTSRQQYTATSYAYNYNHIAKPVLQTRKEMDEISREEIFPRKRKFVSHRDDFFKKVLIEKPVNSFSGLLKKIAVMQTGEIRHYILYAFVFMLLVLFLAMFNII